METMRILAMQIIRMFVLAGLGYLLFRGGKISLEGGRALGNILIYLVLPAVIINGFLVERTPEHVMGLLYSAGAAAVLLLVSILVSRAVFRKDAIAAFAGAFSNPGFFGIPLIIASLGQGAVFYAAGFIAFLNIGQWTYGVSIMTGQPVREGFKPEKLIRTPFVIAVAIGLVLFAFGIRLPGIVTDTLSAVTALNTPLAMFTVGIYLAQTDILRMVRKPSLYAVSGIRLILVPLIALALLSLLPSAWHDMKLVLLLVVSCPVGSNVAVYAQLHGRDYAYAVETVVISTLFSLVTIPAVAWLATLIW